MKQSDPRVALRRVYFLAVDTAALQTRLQSSDMGTIAVYLSKNGAAPALSAAVPVQVDATNAKGLFYVPLAAADIDTIGSVQLIITSTGGTKVMEKREIEVEVKQAFFATVTSATTTVVTCDRAESTANHWLYSLVEVVQVPSGSGGGQLRPIVSSSTGVITVDSAYPFAVAPIAGTIIELLSS